MIGFFMTTHNHTLGFPRIGLKRELKKAEEEAPGLQGYVPQIVVTAPAAIRGDYADGSPFAWELTEASVRKSHDIAPLYKDVAERHGCLFADASELAEVSPDAMHLTGMGHRQVADLIADIIS